LAYTWRSPLDGKSYPPLFGGYGAFKGSCPKKLKWWAHCSIGLDLRRSPAKLRLNEAPQSLRSHGPFRLKTDRPLTIPFSGIGLPFWQMAQIAEVVANLVLSGACFFPIKETGFVARAGSSNACRACGGAKSLCLPPLFEHWNFLSNFGTRFAYGNNVNDSQSQTGKSQC
jgi:hypothetical protein